LGEILEYVQGHRESPAPFDAVLAGHTDPDPATAGDTVGPYREAGLTWWLEKIEPDHRNTIPETLERIEAGPPRP
jgi:hypothetical protein